MTKRKIIIDDTKCVGCGLCANTCKQSAIEMVDGKAKVVREDYCDGIGNCLPVCPVGAISFSGNDEEEKVSSDSALNQWPVQIKLIPVQAEYFNNAHLLIAADCTAYSYKEFHETFMKDKITIIGCPKLDMEDYSVKLAEILEKNDIQSVTVTRMEVPCCGGIEYAAEQAIKNSGKCIPLDIKTITIKGLIK